MTDPQAEALAHAVAYAMARTAPISDTETGRDYANRLAPLMVASGYLTNQPSADAAPTWGFVQALERQELALREALADVTRYGDWRSDVETFVGGGRAAAIDRVLSEVGAWTDAQDRGEVARPTEIGQPGADDSDDYITKAEAESWIEHRTEAAMADAEARIREDEAQKWRSYARHDYRCDALNMTARPCTCGLAALLAKT